MATPKAEAAAAPAPPPPAPKKEEWQSWSKWYSSHSPVYYNEMVERWGGEDKLWDAYADGKMERDEAVYFEGPKIWNSARAFGRVVLPRLKAMEARIAEQDARIDQLQELVLSGPEPSKK